MTAQVHEKLILDGERTTMACCPDLPDHPRVQLAEADRPNPNTPFDLHFSTACWRGYVATWQIKDGRLFLVAIKGRYRLLGDAPLFADWFSGTLRVPRGKMRTYVHFGFGSSYERELLIEVERGMVVSRTVVDDPHERRHAPRSAVGDG